MKQKIVLGSVAALAGVAALWVGGAYYAGKSAEATLERQHKWLADQPYFVVKGRTYQRGWFSSTETATLAVNPELTVSCWKRKASPFRHWKLPTRTVCCTARSP